MEITCSFCSIKLAIPDESLPKDVDFISGECPNCHQKVRIDLKEKNAVKSAPPLKNESATISPPSAVSPSAPKPVSTPAPTTTTTTTPKPDVSPKTAPTASDPLKQQTPKQNVPTSAVPAKEATPALKNENATISPSSAVPSSAPKPVSTPTPTTTTTPKPDVTPKASPTVSDPLKQQIPKQNVPTGTVPTQKSSTPLTEDTFDQDRRLSMICFDDPQSQNTVKTALEALGYIIHIPSKVEEAVEWVKKNKYEVVIIHETYGGSEEKNLILKTIQPMAMQFRRHMCVGLVGKKFKTLDNMMSFAKSVNFVVDEQELSKIKSIIRHAIMENDQFYHIFMEVVHNAGKI